MTKHPQPVNPFCTGGGGHAFEWLVAVSYLVSLLRQELARGAECVVREVRLQQRNQQHPVDDIVVIGELGCATRTLYVQAKHHLRFSNNRLFNEVIAAAWREFSRPSFKRSVDKIGLAIGEACKSDVRDVLSWAASHADADRYYQTVHGFPAKRKVLEAFEQAIGRAMARSPKRSEVWGFLKHLLVLQFDFDDRDRVDCWDRLRHSVDRGDARHAKALFDVLFGMAAEYAPRAGEITRDDLAQRIRERTSFDVPALRLGGPGVLELLARHLSNRIAAEKNSKKYIPDIFVEVGPIKDKARLFCDPALFLRKVEDDVRRLNLRYLNRMLEKAGLETLKLSLPRKRVATGKFLAVEHDAAVLGDALRALLRSLGPVANEGSRDLQSVVPKAKSEIFEQARPYLAISAHGIASLTIPELLDRLQIARSRVFCVVSRAGQGKTNFICDLVEHVLVPRHIPCALFTGRELRGVGKGQLCDYIARCVIGANPERGVDTLLRAMESDAARRNVAAIIIVDGLNEHDDLPTFATEVEGFIEKCLQYPHLRVMVTCRSEYFDSRFANLGQASFAGLTVTVKDIHREMKDVYKSRMIAGYFEFFKIRCRMHEMIEKRLTDDPLLLRFFCEAYADSPKELVVGTICKDALFRTYLGKKLAAVTETRSRRTGFLVGDRHPYQGLLRTVVEWMIGNSQFDSVPTNVFQQDELRSLTDLIDEDIFLRKDLPGGMGVLSNRDEVVSFTFGELRDFLLADHLLSIVLPQDAQRCEELIRKLTSPACTVSEGIAQYLFFGSRYRKDNMAMAIVEKQAWYDELFVPYVFDLDDDLITGDDICKLRQICQQDDPRVPAVIRFLLLRYDKQEHPTANISVLFGILDGMTEDQYRAAMYATFGEGTYQMRLHYPITMLTRDLRPYLLRTGAEWQPSFSELARLLLYLWDIRDERYGYPARQLFAEFERVHPELASNLITEHVAGQCKGYKMTEENALLLAAWRSRSKASSYGSTKSSAGPGADSPIESTGRHAATTLRNTDIGIVIISKRRPTLEACLARAKVRAHSYAGELVRRLHESYVEDAVDLKVEFDRYYRPEYASIDRFLYYKHGCGPKDIRALKTDLNSDRFVGLVQEALGRDWNTGAIVERAEEGDRALCKILGAQWAGEK